MNSPIKIYLTINLEGSVLIRQDKPDFIKSEINGIQRHFPKVCKPASKTINLCEDAYDYFISDEVPHFCKSKRDWMRLSRKQRVHAHCKRICENEGGKDFEFTILED